MLQQSLLTNFSIGSLSELCENLRADCGTLDRMTVSANTVIFDVLTTLGLPMNAIKMILKPEELEALGVTEVIGDYKVKCQKCGEEEAQQLVRVRGNWVLLCDDCKSHLKHI